MKQNTMNRRENLTYRRGNKEYRQRERLREEISTKKAARLKKSRGQSRQNFNEESREAKRSRERRRENFTEERHEAERKRLYDNG